MANNIRRPSCPYSDTSANLSALNEILESGQIVYDTTAQKYKMGDGIHRWNELEYVTNGGVGKAIKNGGEIFNDYTNNSATGIDSHAEGNRSTASGDYSHAENNSQSNGVYSHSEGMMTQSNGRYSHAEGTYTNANGDAQHVEGRFNIVDTNSKYVHIVGNGSSPSSRKNAHSLDWKGNAWFSGDVYVGSTSGKDKDEGSKKLVTEDKIVGMKIENGGEIFNYYDENTASGLYSHAEGCNVIADGDYSHAENIYTVSEGEYSHAEGNGTYSNATGSHAEGNGTVANGEYQHVQGKFNIFDTTNAHIVGNGKTTFNPSNAHTLDWEGNAWYAGDIYVGSTSGKNKDEGSKKLATEDKIVGMKTEQGGEIFNSNYNIATGENSHAEGESTQANTFSAHAEGSGTVANGDSCHAEGCETSANGQYCHSEGWGTIASGQYQHVQGKYNLEDTKNKYAHIVGNGDTEWERSNAHTLDWEGNAWYAGDIQFKHTDGHTYSMQAILKAIIDSGITVPYVE